MKPRFKVFIWTALACYFFLGGVLQAQTTGASSNTTSSSGSSDGLGFEVRLSDANGDTDFGVVIQLLVLMSLLSIAPGIIMLMTSFLRIIIVLGFFEECNGFTEQSA